MVALHTNEERIVKLISADPQLLSAIDDVLFGSTSPKEDRIIPPVSVSKAAKLLGKSRTTIYRWIDGNVLHPIDIKNGNRLIPWHEVERLAGKAS